jgi:hypothetical protein
MTDSTRVTIANIQTTVGVGSEGKALVADGDGNVVLSGITGGTTDHGTLDGLADDDHTQYILHSLADATSDFLVATGADTFAKKTLAETGAILEADLDHGNIQGIGDDDHTQYFLLAGETTDAKLYSGADLIIYSDAGSTEKARIDGATGNITTAGTVDGKDIATHVDDTTIHFDELGELSNVSVAGVSQGEVLTYAGSDWTPSGIMVHAAIPCYSFKNDIDVVIADGVGYLPIPYAFDGYDVVYVHAEVKTAGTTGTTDIQLRNITQSQDILSTKLTIDSGETGSDTAATPAVINLSNDDLSAYDLLAVDVDAKSTTAAKGLIVTVGMRKP